MAFLFPLLLGFAFNSASAFTAAYSRRWGERRGQGLSLVLRDVLGIPVWALGYILAARTPSPALFTSSWASQALGWLLILAGAAVIVVGLRSLGWRAVSPSLSDSLVESGLYARVRHPLYSGMLLELAGLAVLLPTPPMLVACALGVIWTLLQARLEELDLLQRLPGYADYMRRVPRFVPRLFH